MAMRALPGPGSWTCSHDRSEACEAPNRGAGLGLGAACGSFAVRRFRSITRPAVLTRISVIALNTYREAVRARVLHGLFGLALATGAYALVVASYTTRDHERVVSDLGSASISIYGIIVAVVLGASSLYQELQLKTIFPILTRPLRRWEYLVGKYLGTLLTLIVFICMNAGVLLLALASMAGKPVTVTLGAASGLLGLAAVAAWRLPRLRVYTPIPLALVMIAVSAFLADGVPDDRRVLLASALLTCAEVGIVAAIATVFSSFSSPFLTAMFTFSVFIVGRSADTLARLPTRMFGDVVARTGEMLSHVVPNLMFYVPPRSLLTGEAAAISLSDHLVLALGQAAAWIVGLLVLASAVFRRRDFL